MGFVDAVKDFVGFGDVDYDDDDYMEDEAEEQVEEKQSRFSRKNKVVSIDRGMEQPSIVIIKPNCFDAAKEAADKIKQRHPIVLDVTGLDTEEARRSVDFITGTVYGVNGDIQKVTGGIFIATPSSYSISGDYLKGKASAGLDWTIFK